MPSTKRFNRVREAREEKGWTLDQLSFYLREEFPDAVGYRMVQSIERGEREPSKDTMHQLAAVLGKSLDYLFPNPYDTDN